MIPVLTPFDGPTHVLSTNIANGGYVRLGRVPLTSARKGCTVRVRGIVDASGTETDALVTVAVAHDPDTAGASYFALSVLASHSTNSDTNGDPGYVLRYFRVGMNTTDGYAYLDVEIRKNPTVSISITPIENGDWGWFSGSTTTNVSAYSLTRTTSVLAYGGFTATNLTANAASSATYASALYSGGTLSDNNAKTSRWENFGQITIDYNASYLGGRSFNGEFRLKENSASKAASELEDIVLHLAVQLGAHAGAAAFNALVPTLRLEVEGATTLTGSDFALLVLSTSTSQKLVRLYVRLKDENTHYSVNQVTRFGGAYTSTLALTTSYIVATTLSNQAVLVSLPTPAQGSVTYAAIRKVPIGQLPVGTGANEVAAGDHAHTIPYDFNLTCTPKPVASQKLLIHAATRAFRVASTGHTGKCHVNPTTSSAVLTLKKNGTSFGTLTFSTAGAFSMSVTQTDFAIGDILTVEAPSSQNSTFADFGATIVATVL